MNPITTIYNRFIGVRLSWIILIFLTILIIYFGIEYYNGKIENHTTALYGGLITSLIAVIIQMLMEWNEHREIETFKKMGILKVLPNRDGKQDYYYRLIVTSQNAIDFMGLTSASFLRDFGNEDEHSGEKASALVRAIKRGVNIRFLISKKEHLDPSKHQKFDEAKLHLESLSKKYPNKFSYLYLSHKPSHTLVTADKQCIVGPIIPECSSDITSAIHAETNSPYLKCFIEHFDREWKKSIKN